MGVLVICGQLALFFATGQSLNEMRPGIIHSEIDMYSYFLQLVVALQNLEGSSIFYGTLKEDHIFYFPEYEYFCLNSFGNSKKTTKGMKIGSNDVSGEVPPELRKNKSKANPYKLQVWKLGSFFKKYNLKDYPLIEPLVNSMTVDEPNKRPKLAHVRQILEKSLWFDFNDVKKSLDIWKEAKITEILKENSFKVINQIKLEYLLNCDEKGNTSSIRDSKSCSVM